MHAGAVAEPGGQVRARSHRNDQNDLTRPAAWTDETAHVLG
jgi:hypothetical protein